MGRLYVHLHDPEDYGKVFLVGVLGVLELDKGGLGGNKGGHLVVGEAGGGEDGDLSMAEMPVSIVALG